MTLRAGGEPDAVADLLGRNLRRARLDAGLTQVAVAERTGITRTHYAALESGSSSNGGVANPRLSTLLDLSAALGVTLHDLLAGVESVER